MISSYFLQYGLSLVFIKSQSTSKVDVKWVLNTHSMDMQLDKRKKIVEVPNSALFLPGDVVIEILSSVEAKFLLRCTCANDGMLQFDIIFCRDAHDMQQR